MEALNPQEPTPAGQLTQLTDSDEYKLLRDMLSVRHYLHMMEKERARSREDVLSSPLPRQAVAAALEASQNGPNE